LLRDGVRERIHLVPKDNYVADKPNAESAAPSVPESLQRDVRKRVAKSQWPSLYFAGFVLLVIAELIFITSAILLTYIAVTRGETISEPIETLHAFSGPLILLVSAAVSTVFGFIVLRAAGAADTLVIPREDRDVLVRMVEENNEPGIKLYTDLAALPGMTGFFHKMGVSGLPLATITLSVISGY
jgi:hypothetical protein